MEIGIPSYFGEMQDIVSYYLLETYFGLSVFLGGVLWGFFFLSTAFTSTICPVFRGPS